MVEGYSDDYMFLTCFADNSTSEFIVGNGPSNITVAYDRMDDAASYELYVREYEGEGQLSPGEYRDRLERSLLLGEQSLQECVQRRTPLLIQVSSLA